MKINKRLKRVASFVDDNSYLIDVGCDHALLCIYLVKNKNNIKCIASDLREGPLEQAKKNIKDNSCSDFIKVKLGNGLDTLESDIDTVVISGMGGKTISDILLKCSDFSNIEKMIISSNNDVSLVRKTAIKLGFYIKCEEIVFDKGKYYSIIVFDKVKRKYNKTDIVNGYNVLYNDDLMNYYEYLVRAYKEKKYKLPKKYFIEKIKIDKNICFLNRRLRKLRKI